MAETDSIGTSVPTLLRSYADDYAGWVEDTARAIEEGRFSEIDRVALADEVRDLGKSERARIESALRILVLHLLKTKHQPEKRTNSCEASIRVQRRHVAQFLLESPSLQPDVLKLVSSAYDDARIDAANETGIDINLFPEACESGPWRKCWRHNHHVGLMQKLQRSNK